VTLDAYVVADDDNLDLATQYGFSPVHCPNDRMGRKWNEGFFWAAMQGADFFVLIGSDNWIHPTAFDRPPQEAVSAARSIDFVDLERGVVQHAHGPALIPWIIPRALLAPSGFTPFPDRMQRGTEAMLAHALGHPPVVERDGPPGVDFKSAESVSPYAGVRNSIGDGVEHDIRELERHYPAHLVEAARLISEENA
jgi:hypothetical protein